jgi:hypothetical protein
MPTFKQYTFHEQLYLADRLRLPTGSEKKTKIIYDLKNHFHPHLDALLSKLNRESLAGLMDVNFHQSLVENFFKDLYEPNTADKSLQVNYDPAKIDLDEDGAYSIYNWELFFHVPITVAVHLSKQQRFAEAQRWFHYIFDPTSTDMHVPAPKRFWKFLAFRHMSDMEKIDELFTALAEAALEDDHDNTMVENFKAQIEGWRNKPFQPHAIARTRFVAYQYQVVMKYLDNLVAWGDSLFRQDTIEAIKLYGQAADILGPKPQEVPRRGTIRPQNFRSLRNRLNEFGNALVEMEGEFPFNLFEPGTANVDSEKVNTMLGVGQSLYFCLPRNEKLLSYWDLVADRLFKIRNCMNIEGIVRQLPLFEPPIDSGMLVKAAAAGIDISSIGLNQPPSPVRAMLLIQKALEICNEVRNLGNNLLSALEKRDNERLSLLRQRQDIEVQKMALDVRFLQWKETEANTDALLRSRETVYQRYRHYQMLMGVSEANFADQATLQIQRQNMLSGETPEEIASNFNDLYDQMLDDYASDTDLSPYPPKEQAGKNSPSNQSGATGLGNLNLNKNENEDLNIKMPEARKKLNDAGEKDELYGFLSTIPDLGLNFNNSVGSISIALGGGSTLNKVGQTLSGKDKLSADKDNYEGNRASKTSSYERRSEDWILQSNLAAKELRQIGQQIVASLIREKMAEKEYHNQIRQIELLEEQYEFLQDKFTNVELYTWMQSEISKVYYDCYKFAFDVSKQAERALKMQIMRPELDQRDFIKFNYWDGGRKGLLSGEGLYLDLKRMEMAYYEHNKREYEMVKHVSLRQLNPMALLRLKATGVCEVQVPEWLFDLDCPGHYFRRIKTVALSIPCVAGPYTGINCQLSLQKSTIRKSPLLRDGEYGRDLEGIDDRFIDYYGTIQSIVTSSGQNDSGLFEVNLNDERLLPFEYSGAESTWRLELPQDLRQFNYDTISDIILHIRYIAREADGQVKAKAQEYIKSMIEEANTSGIMRLWSLRHEFSAEWHKYVSSENANFRAEIKKEHFPYFVQGSDIEIADFQLFVIEDNALVPLPLAENEIVNSDGPLAAGQKLRHTLDMLNDDTLRKGDNIEIVHTILDKEKEVFLMMRYVAKRFSV